MPSPKHPTAANPDEPLSATQELLAAGKALGEPQMPDGREPYVIVPGGYDVVYLPEKNLPELPDHIRQRVELNDAGSFVSYVKKFKTHTTTIFANVPDLSAGVSAARASFTALFDYHEGGKDSKALRNAHSAVYPCPFSVEFQTWLKHNKQGLSQEAFIEFIDANAVDVASPPSADLLELAMNFEARKDVQFASKVDRVTGGRVLKFSEVVDAHQASGQMKVPEMLVLVLPVFEGGKAYEMTARLEWRVNNGKMTVAYHLNRPHEVLRKALGQLRLEIAEDTGLGILTGKVL